MADQSNDLLGKGIIALAVAVAGLAGALVTNGISSISQRVDAVMETTRRLETFSIEHQKKAEYRFGVLDERGKLQARANQELSVNRSQALNAESAVSEARIRALESQVAELRREIATRGAGGT